MLKPETVDDISRKLAELIPQDIKDMRREFHQNAKAVLTAGLRKMDLVTREEFDVQQAVLAKTRQKLKVLEAEIRALESRLANDQDTRQ